MRRPFFIANWKMNILASEARQFCDSFAAKLKGLPCVECDIGIAPAYTSLLSVVQSVNDRSIPVVVGAQNVHWLPNGAHTGEISVPMLKEAGAKFVIVGHSERRQFYGETDAGVAQRAKAAITGELIAVVCVGETRAEYEAGVTERRIAEQLSGSLAGIERAEIGNLVIAYEPVWAIGTGLAATAEGAAKVHRFIRSELRQAFGSEADQIRLLYGGSTTPKNVEELLGDSDIDGSLVGGASLVAEQFGALISGGLRAKGLL